MSCTLPGPKRRAQVRSKKITTLKKHEFINVLKALKQGLMSPRDGFSQSYTLITGIIVPGIFRVHFFALTNDFEVTMILLLCLHSLYSSYYSYIFIPFRQFILHFWAAEAEGNKSRFMHSKRESLIVQRIKNRIVQG